VHLLASHLYGASRTNAAVTRKGPQWIRQIDRPVSLESSYGLRNTGLVSEQKK
jgi:hypothetical protein